MVAATSELDVCSRPHVLIVKARVHAALSFVRAHMLDIYHGSGMQLIIISKNRAANIFAVS